MNLSHETLTSLYKSRGTMRKEIDRLKAELKKYSEGVEVEGVVTLNGWETLRQCIALDEVTPYELGQPVTVNVRVKE